MALASQEKKKSAFDGAIVRILARAQWQAADPILQFIADLYRRVQSEVYREAVKGWMKEQLDTTQTRAAIRALFHPSSPDGNTPELLTKLAAILLDCQGDSDADALRAELLNDEATPTSVKDSLR
jgi:hypothetical protein